jgi:hypothetical protein
MAMERALRGGLNVHAAQAVQISRCGGRRVRLAGVRGELPGSDEAIELDGNRLTHAINEPRLDCRWNASARFAYEGDFKNHFLALSIASVGARDPFEIKTTNSLDVAVGETKDATRILQKVGSLDPVRIDRRLHVSRATALSVGRINRDVEPTDGAQWNAIKFNVDDRWHRVGHDEPVSPADMMPLMFEER